MTIVQEEVPEINSSHDELVGVLGVLELGPEGGVRLTPPHRAVSLLLQKLRQLRSTNMYIASDNMRQFYALSILRTHIHPSVKHCFTLFL